MSIFNDPNFDSILAGIVYDSRVQSPDCDLITSESEEWEDYAMNDDDVYLEDDGQPTHYEEYQDLYGGDYYIEQWEDDYGDY